MGVSPTAFIHPLPVDVPLRFPHRADDVSHEITLHSGRNRIVRRMMAEVGHPVIELVRRQQELARRRQYKEALAKQQQIKREERALARAQAQKAPAIRQVTQDSQTHPRDT